MIEICSALAFHLLRNPISTNVHALEVFSINNYIKLTLNLTGQWFSYSGLSAIGNNPDLCTAVIVAQSGSGHVAGHSKSCSNIWRFLCGQGWHGCPGLQDQQRPCASLNLCVSCCCASAEATKQPKRAATTNILFNNPKFIKDWLLFLHK